MVIQTTKIKLVELLQSTDNPYILKSIKEIFRNTNSLDFWVTLSTEQQKERKEATIDLDNGNKTDFEVFISKHR